jgi:hypothetical protein
MEKSEVRECVVECISNITILDSEKISDEELLEENLDMDEIDIMMSDLELLATILNIKIVRL